MAHKTANALKIVYRPMWRRLYVRVHALTGERTTESGKLIIPDRAYSNELSAQCYAEVVQVGPEVDPELAPGTWVMIPRFGGTQVCDDQTYRIVSEDQIICILDPSEARRELGIA